MLFLSVASLDLQWIDLFLSAVDVYMPLLVP